MEKGPLSERYLDNALLLNFKKSEKVSMSPGIGSDYSETEGIVTADGFGESIEVAFIKALSNFYCSLSEPVGIRALFMLPESTRQSNIKAYMDTLNTMSKERDLLLLGGHSQVLADIREPQFYITVIGREGSFRVNKKEIATGDQIVMLGYTGMLGTNNLCKDNLDKLKERFNQTYIDSARFSINDLSGFKIFTSLKEEGLIEYVHDGSFSGVYGALWQLGRFIDRGIYIDNKKIPIKQETVEICDYLDLNPYLIDATGAFLVLTKNGKKLCEMCKGLIEASVIGYVAESKERLVKLSDSDIRTLSPT